MVNGCCGKTLIYEGIYIFTDMRQFVKILIGYMDIDKNNVEMILCQKHSKAKKRTCYWLFGPFFRESGIVFSRFHPEAVKKIKSIEPAP